MNFLRLIALLLPLSGWTQTAELRVDAPALAACGDTIVVDVRGTFPGFELIGMQLSVAWDSTALRPIDYTVPTLAGAQPLVGNFTDTAQSVGYVWIRQSGWATLDSTSVLQLRFRVARGSGWAPIRVTNLPTSVLAFDTSYLTLLPPTDLALVADSVRLIDPTNRCGDGLRFDAQATIQTPSGVGVEGVFLNVSTSFSGAYANSQTMLTDANGEAALAAALPELGDVEVTPTLDEDPLNGVSTYDLYLLRRHVQGQSLLNSPYKIIAADVDGSGSVNLFDIIRLQRLILGLETDFLNNTSWRFVDATQVFPDPANPFTALPWRESIALPQVQTQPAPFSFVGIKTGDLNGNVSANSLIISDIREPEWLSVEDQSLVTGQVIDLSLRWPDGLVAAQATLECGSGCQFELATDAAATLALHDGRHTATWGWDASAGVPPTTRLRVRATANGQLRHQLRVTNRITPTQVAYADGVERPVELHFLEKNTPSHSVATLPNPWREATRIAFFQTKNDYATLHITDATGRVVYTTTSRFAEGEAFFDLQKSDVPTGWLRYRVVSSGGVLTGHMLHFAD
jgi:hypothetical protein